MEHRYGAQKWNTKVKYKDGELRWNTKIDHSDGRTDIGPRDGTQRRNSIVEYREVIKV